MFTRIAPRYDFLNHLLSFSLDRIWRRRTAKHFLHILSRPEARVLDLCCGTGDLTFALDRARSAVLDPLKRRAPVVGSDFVEAMLVRARDKAVGSSGDTIFAAADALHLPFSDASIDLITTAFGFRNLANYEDGLREFARVLQPGRGTGHPRIHRARLGPDGRHFPVLLPPDTAADRRRDLRRQGSLRISPRLRLEVPFAARTRRADGKNRLRRRSHRLLEFRQRDPAFRPPRLAAYWMCVCHSEQSDRTCSSSRSCGTSGHAVEESLFDAAK